jgi:hypothetical protein
MQRFMKVQRWCTEVGVAEVQRRFRGAGADAAPDGQR